MTKKYKRIKPYTQIGIRRLACYKCGKRPSVHQWQICADGNIWRPTCRKCDIELNKIVLEWLNDKKAAIKIEKYSERQ